MRKKRALVALGAIIFILTFVMAFSPFSLAEAKTKYVVAWYADPGAGMNL